MTVAELIIELQKHEQDIEVSIGYEGTHGPFSEIYTLEENWVIGFAGKPVLRHPKLVVVATD